MRSLLHASLAADPQANEAADIVRSCVHCGFCTATCPTYQVTGDERDGPRGRIYFAKAWLESAEAGATTRFHLERCLLCRSCETTCPSGVRYGRLMELVRPRVAAQAGLTLVQRVKRAALLHVIPYPARWRAAVGLGRLLRPLLPRALAAPLALADASAPLAPAPHARRVLLLGGCAQQLLNPATDRAAMRLFDRLGMRLDRLAGVDCCGALSYHLGDEPAALRFARANLDAWWPAIEAGAEAVIASASGCGLHLRGYAELLADDPAYAARARRLVELVRDPIELVDVAALRGLLAGHGQRVAVQTPCTLQHGQKLNGRIEALLGELGWQVLASAEGHLCCGSAGAYSLLEPAMSRTLRDRKLGNLMAEGPELIVTANIGCQLHLAAAARVPVRHWLEVLADRLA